MSLSVPGGLLERAQQGEVDDAAFLDCVRASLPYAWSVISGLIADLGAGEGAVRRQPRVAPPDEAARGQLLRLMASDAMRAAVERHYGVQLAFQNCHRAAVFRPQAAAALAEFTSARSQLLNQSPSSSTASVLEFASALPQRAELYHRSRWPSSRAGRRNG